MIRSIVRLLRVLSAALLVLSASAAVHAFASYSKWTSTSVTVYINPANADLSPSAAASAIQTAMAAWNAAGSAARFSYGGTVSTTSTGLDRRNVVVFRNATNGSAIATTYSWWDSGTRLLDSDVVFWDGGTRFFSGTSGCGGSHAAYVEDIAAHELGHVLGLSHSSYSDATMKSSYGNCSQALRSIWLDDMAGAQFLYPTSGNTKPTLSITAPASGASFTFGTPVSFAGSAIDVEDGNRSSSMLWISSRDGQLGTGGGFTRIASIGSHRVTIFATDARGLVSSRTVDFTVVAASVPTLLVEPPTTLDGLLRVTLRWSGFPSTVSSVDVYRNGSRIATTANDGKHVDSLGTILSMPFYRLCAAASTTCTDEKQASVW